MDNSSPKYHQLFDLILNDIARGKYPPGSFLPTEKQFVEEYGVGRNTVRRSLLMLHKGGFIKVTQGSGSVVLEMPYSKMDTFNSKVWAERRRNRVITMDFYIEGEETSSPPLVDTVYSQPDVSRTLNIPNMTEIFRIQRLRMINGIAYCYRVSYVRKDIIPDLEQDIMQTDVLLTIIEKYGFNRTKGDDKISAKTAGFIEAQLLNVEPGSSLLYTHRVCHCEKGAYEYSESFINPKLAEYLISL